MDFQFTSFQISILLKLVNIWKCQTISSFFDDSIWRWHVPRIPKRESSTTWMNIFICSSQTCKFYEISSLNIISRARFKMQNILAFLSVHQHSCRNCISTWFQSATSAKNLRQIKSEFIHVHRASFNWIEKPVWWLHSLRSVDSTVHTIICWLSGKTKMLVTWWSIYVQNSFHRWRFLFNCFSGSAVINFNLRMLNEH